MPETSIVREIIQVSTGYVTCAWTSLRDGKMATFVYAHSDPAVKEEFLLHEIETNK